MEIIDLVKRFAGHSGVAAVQKVWNDANNQDGKRPSSITINLLKNGKVIDTKRMILTK